ncbi:MAG: glycosyltransferase family 4 protein [Chloroflexi bacterium]|nr:glycosyltransferase family 4 protein [Chloroflexota bacterium]
MTRLKIALMGHFPPTGPARGGVQTVIASLRDVFSTRADIELHLIQHRQNIPTATVTQDGYTAHHFAAATSRFVPNMIRTPGLLTPFLRELAPDVISTHQFEYALAAFDSGIPTVHTIHGFPAKEFRVRRTIFTRLASLMDMWMEWQTLRRATDIIAISNHVIQLYQHRTHATFHRVNNPVSLSFFAPSLEPEPYRLVFIGNLTPRKGVEVAIAAIARIKEEFPQIRFDIVGAASDSAYVAKLRELAEPLGKSVCFCGSPDRAGIKEALGRAQALVLTSHDEHAPVIVAEAMASARPVIATKVGALPDMIEEGVTGYLAEVANVEAVAEAMRRVLRDPRRTKKMGAEAAVYARREYHPEAVADGYLRAMNVAMKRGK